MSNTRLSEDASHPSPTASKRKPHSAETKKKLRILGFERNLDPEATQRHREQSAKRVGKRVSRYGKGTLDPDFDEDL